MTDKTLDRMIAELMQNDDWSIVMGQLRMWLQTDDHRLDALLDDFAKIKPRNIREARIKTYLLIATMRILALSHLDCLRDDPLNDAISLHELSPLIQ